MKRLLVTIDGPAGAGKTTVSRMLAARLGYRYVDTGALYRAVALAALEKGVSSEDDAALAALMDSLSIAFAPGDGGQRVMANGRDITDLIRTPEVTMTASRASARPVVREGLLELQRRMGAEKGCVFEGRDMGTVVFPDADVKFFLSASVEERARRRWLETRDKTGQAFEEVRQDIARRDENDTKRSLSPLKPAKDAILIDSTKHPAAEVVDIMMARIASKVGEEPARH